MTLYFYVLLFQNYCTDVLSAGTQHIQGASLVVGQEAVSRRTHTNKYLLFQSCLEVWTLHATLEHINWASKLSQIHPIGLLKTCWNFMEDFGMGVCFVAGFGFFKNTIMPSGKLTTRWLEYPHSQGFLRMFPSTQPDCLQKILLEAKIQLPICLQSC